MKVEFGSTDVGRVIFPFSRPTSSDDSSSFETPRISQHVTSPMVFSGIFSAAECDNIIKFGESLPLRTGQMMDARPNCRRSRISWLMPSEATSWLYEKITGIFRSVNRWYGFDLIGFIDAIQYTAYDGGDGFGWHLDTGPGQTSTRKLSMSVQLTAGDSYEGGDLEFCASDSLYDARRQGTVIVFPSFLAHRVSPLLRGQRRALVAWAHGPAFR